MKISGIYKIVNKINNKYYVGSSGDIFGHSGRGRKYNHFWLLRHNQHKNTHLQNAFNKYGENSFELVVIEQVESTQLLIVEQKYLDIAKNEQDKCYNISFIAGKVEMTPEVRQKISQANKGENHGMFGKKGELSPLYGKPRSDETKEKIGVYWRKQYENGYVNPNKGKPMSEEQKIKVSNSRKGKCVGKENGFYGRKHSKETKLKWSQSKKGQYSGNKHPMYNDTVYTFKHTVTGEIFVGTQFDFRTKFGISSSLLGHLMNGKSKTCKKWILVTNDTKEDSTQPMERVAISTLLLY